MNLLATLRIAIRALAKNKMRASLTVLGVVIGIAAVTAMVSIGQSASSLVQGQFDSLGTNVVIVRPASRRRFGVRQGTTVTLTAEDSDAIAQECPSVVSSSPIVGFAAQMIYGNSNWSPRELYGVGEQYLAVRNWGLGTGGFFTERDIDSASKVCVIGHTLVAKLFQTTNPIGEKIRINNIPFEVIGVLEAKGANLVGEDQDDIVLVPVSTMQKRLYGSHFQNVHAIMATAKSSDSMSDAEFDIRQLLLERHRIGPDEMADFQVQNMTEIADILGVVTGTMTLMLASIAGISLVVGGVGIMNTMLVSVTERTREIGIRMAVGAQSKDILLQFLVESVVLSFVGGVIGFALGVGGSVALTTAINSFSSGTDWPVVISIPAAVVAIVFAAGVGIFFGFYPALKASRLDPIDALRYE
ncbi:ABC transporter permease [Adhaeretor mobilis]|uniref:Macrolide export ATP-binding/permease protein MacB n=1 Tax=Adhaeretor mobilis TaxID=1930276 RepID=A0A517MYF1_9BACT|nr:ABC transporter permease [Adhaeretor mobilis]QDS99911.1 Macrolide export ATP-binding/permease protein MacB [Adhaeretor mobilis]